MSPILLSLLLLLSLSSLAKAHSQPPTQSDAQEQKPDESLGAAARKVKAERGNSGARKVINEDDLAALPHSGVSVVGKGNAESGTSAEDRSSNASAGPGAPNVQTEEGEAYWKARFAATRGRLASSQKELNILKDELSTAQREQPGGSRPFVSPPMSESVLAIQRNIDAMKRKVQENTRELTDLEEEFRKSDGQPGWIRE
jgi:hypothetical protein